MKIKKIITLSAILNIFPLLCSAFNVTSVVLPSQLGVALTNLFNFIFGFLLVFGVLFIMLAGYQFVTAGGDPNKIEAARNQLLWAIIGLLLAGLAKAITVAVANLLGRTS